MHLRIGADLGRKVLVGTACRSSHGSEIAFCSAVPPPVTPALNSCSCQRGRRAERAAISCLAAGSLLLLRIWVSLVSLSGAARPDAAQQLHWGWLYLLSLCPSPACGLFAEQKCAEMWSRQKYLSVHQQEVARGRQVWMRQRGRSVHTRMSRVRRPPGRTGADLAGPGCRTRRRWLCRCRFAHGCC